MFTSTIALQRKQSHEMTTKKTEKEENNIMKNNLDTPGSEKIWNIGKRKELGHLA